MGKLSLTIVQMPCKNKFPSPEVETESVPVNVTRLDIYHQLFFTSQGFSREKAVFARFRKDC